MIYAPIIIPTCNRYEHFYNCIKSLQENTLAKNTELFISLDFPPASRYEEGNKKIRKYLEKGITGFKNVFIYYQQSNLGAYNNELFLINKVFDKYDRYIFTEDDNIFSPNFIEYVDKGLELFEESENIIAICGTRASEGKRENDQGNVVLSRKFIGYGFGIWKKKYLLLLEKINRKYLSQHILPIKNMISIYKKNSSLLLAYAAAVLKKEKVYVRDNGEIPLIDETIKIYLEFEDKYVLHPLDIIVLNLGCDGSGLNCRNNHKVYNKSMLSTDQSFDFEIPSQLNIREYTRADEHGRNRLRCYYAMFSLIIYRLVNGE